MKRTATTLCVTIALAAAPAVGYACTGDGGGTASADSGKVTSAGNPKKLKRCKKQAYARYQGPDLNRALKKCQKKYG